MINNKGNKTMNTVNVTHNNRSMIIHSSNRLYTVKTKKTVCNINRLAWATAITTVLYSVSGMLGTLSLYVAN